MEILGIVAAVILAVSAARMALTYYNTVAATRLMQQDIVTKLRSDVYDKLQRLGFRFFDSHDSGSIINRVTVDAQAVRMFVDGVIIQGVSLALTLAVSLIYMLHIHAGLTLACLATTPVLWTITVAYARRVRGPILTSRERVDRMVLTLSENVQGVHVVKGFGREPEEIRKFAADNAAVRDQQGRIFRASSLYNVAAGLLTHINTVVLIGYGGYLVMTDRLALGSGLLVFYGLLNQFSGQVTAIASVADSIQHSLAGARRFFEILDTPTEILPPARPVRLPKARGSVEFVHVTFGYDPAQPVLEDVHLRVEPGQCIAILGATGSGKSTLLSLIPRFYDPVRGEVRVDGINLRQLHLDDLRRNIGLVFQETFLFSDTVAANIAFGNPDATPAQIIRAARVAAAHEFITKLARGYETVIGERGSGLSGGQRQRLALARAILLEPSILLLDDPTAAIDPQTEYEIQTALDNVMEGRTTFIVSHRLSTLRRADVIIVLDEGRIAQTGTHEELISIAGHYRETANIQFDYAEG
jgi:ATP-binding cassette subfamily B protein